MREHRTLPGQVARTLEHEWRRLANVYLPIRPADSIWWSNRRISPADPSQGWKLHIAATILSAGDILRLIAPCLQKKQIFFKAPKTLAELEKINAGVYYGFGQSGKFVTVYPPSPEVAVALAWELDHLTAGQPAPLIPYDEPLRQGSCIYYRYGQFKSGLKVSVRGKRVPALRQPDGRLVADRREPGTAIPRWVKDPFLREDTPSGTAANSRLETRYAQYEALVQRGRGGVYRAQDRTSKPRQTRILKEGRPHGETDWLGRDGIDRIQREANFLKTVSPRVRGVPRFFTTFRANGCFYLVMEDIAGRNLQAMIAGKESMSVRRQLAYCLDMARILGDIHAAGWAWLDCKPGNFLCEQGGGLRAIDFESARRIKNSDPLCLGTPGYLPPASNDTSGEAQDLFALGASFAQLVARTAFPPAAITETIFDRRFPDVFIAMTNKLLHRDPQKRPAARVVQQALERLLEIDSPSSELGKLPQIIIDSNFTNCNSPVAKGIILYGHKKETSKSCKKTGEKTRQENGQEACEKGRRHRAQKLAAEEKAGNEKRGSTNGGV